MEFIDYIIKNGFSIKCFYEPKTFFNQPYACEINPFNNPNIVPGNLDNKFALLISFLMLKFIDDVYDPFYYDEQSRMATLLVSDNELIKFKLPDNLTTMIDNIGNIDIAENKADFYNYKNNIINEIQKQIFELSDNQMIDRFNKINNMKEETHVLKVIRNNKKHKIGIGKIFASN
jgi:hypothetical protein